MAEVFTVRLSTRAAEYVARLSDGSGLSKAAVIEVLLEGARRRGWSVEPSRGTVTEAEPA